MPSRCRVSFSATTESLYETRLEPLTRFRRMTWRKCKESRKSFIGRSTTRSWCRSRTARPVAPTFATEMAKAGRAHPALLRRRAEQDAARDQPAGVRATAEPQYATRSGRCASSCRRVLRRTTGRQEKDDAHDPETDNVLADLIYNSVTSLLVGEKTMIEMPTYYFPAGAGVSPGNQRLPSHGQPDPMATFRFSEPVQIEPNQNFRVEMLFPQGVPERSKQHDAGAAAPRRRHRAAPALGRARRLSHARRAVEGGSDVARQDDTMQGLGCPGGCEGADGQLYQWVQGVDGLGNTVGCWRPMRCSAPERAVRRASGAVLRRDRGRPPTEISISGCRASMDWAVHSASGRGSSASRSGRCRSCSGLRRSFPAGPRHSRRRRRS